MFTGRMGGYSVTVDFSSLSTHKIISSCNGDWLVFWKVTEQMWFERVDFLGQKRDMTISILSNSFHRDVWATDNGMSKALIGGVEARDIQQSCFIL